MFQFFIFNAFAIFLSSHYEAVRVDWCWFLLEQEAAAQQKVKYLSNLNSACRQKLTDTYSIRCDTVLVTSLSPLYLRFLYLSQHLHMLKG